MVHVISVLLKINKSTRENADCVCVWERESEWGMGRECSYLGRKYDFKSLLHIGLTDSL